MLKLIGLLLCLSVLAVMVQPFEKDKPRVLLGNTADKLMVAKAAIGVVARKQAKPTLQAEIRDGLKMAKLNPTASHVIMDAIMAANNPTEPSFAVDGSVYDRVGEVEQPLQPLNEQDMVQQLVVAGFNADQYQVIVDGIAEANANYSNGGN